MTRHIIKILNPEQMRSVVATGLLAQQQIDYSGPAEVQIMTVAKKDSAEITQYRVEVAFDENNNEESCHD